jgi:hypothetical protein
VRVETDETITNQRLGASVTGDEDADLLTAGRAVSVDLLVVDAVVMVEGE